MWPTGFNGAIDKIYSPGILQNNKIQVNCLPTARTPGHLCDEDNYDDHDDYNDYSDYDHHDDYDYEDYVYDD